jgi:hypothetical protein
MITDQQMKHCKECGRPIMRADINENPENLWKNVKKCAKCLGEDDNFEREAPRFDEIGI